ncbi:MAG: hypothetical protein J6I40_01480 [Mailhella sp.]|nr:hypothetical protein [Mailhella sp.]
MLRKLQERFGLGVSVMCGNLVDEPLQTSGMGTPRLRAFFRRLSDTTGREIGDAFFRLLSKEHSVLMDSSRSCLLLHALKKLAPGHELEQLESFQEAFYLRGQDVLDFNVQAALAMRWGVESNALADALASGEMRCGARQELAKAEEYLGDFVVYPTLFVQLENGSLSAVARGYGPFEKVVPSVLGVLQGLPDAGQKVESAHACGLDGVCH